MEGESLQAGLEFIGSWLAYRAQRVDIPGFAVAIQHTDKLVFSRAYGLAHVEVGETLTTEHLFGVASQSKMFTATAIMQLAEQGKLRLDDFAVDYVPWLARHRDKRFTRITIRQLLTHSAGIIRDGSDTNFWVLERPFPNVSDLRKSVLAADIALTPNSQLKYSNLGFALLGHVIGTASGQAYMDYVREHILQPLALENTFTDYAPALESRLAAAYGMPFDHRRPELAPRAPTKALAPAVGVHATAEDMCRFAAAHFFGNEHLLSDETKLEMQRTQWVLTQGYDRGTERGLGFEIVHSGARRLVGHSGHLAGFITATFFDSHAKLAVAVMTNARDVPVMQIVRGIFEAVDWFAEHAEAPAPKSLARFNARLCNATAAVEIIASKRGITAVSPDDWQPFAWPEHLEKLNAHTLRITTPGSMFSEGELLHYTFADDVVQAVRYAGLTMLPELAYRDQANESEQPYDPQHVLTLDDLQYNDLRVGRILKVESATNPLPCRVLVDFGPELGATYAYLPTLPRPTVAESLIGQAVLGAIFPVWRSGKRLNDVLVIGLANREHTTMPILPGSRLPLLPDPTYPRTIWREAACEHGRAYQREAQRSSFKFQALPDYPIDEIDFPSSSLAAWRQGKRRKSLALMRRHCKDRPFWLRAPTHNVRVVITDPSPSPFVQWSLEFSKRVSVPLGETVYLLPRKCIADLNIPDGDFTIWDDSQAMVNGYTSNHWTHATVYDGNKNEDMTNLLQLKQQLLHLSLTKGQALQQ